MRYVTQESRVRNVVVRLERLIELTGVDVSGVSLSVTDRHSEPYCLRNRIMLPTVRRLGGWEQFAKSFLHELSHARDYLAGNDDPAVEKERRARSWERLYDYAAARPQRKDSENGLDIPESLPYNPECRNDETRRREMKTRTAYNVYRMRSQQSGGPEKVATFYSYAEADKLRKSLLKFNPGHYEITVL